MAISDTRIINNRQNVVIPIFNRVLRINNTPYRPGIQIRYRGLRILFTVNRNGLYYQQLREGKLRFVALPDRLELQLIDIEGIIQILGRVNLGPTGILMHGNQPIKDKSGLIRCDAECHYIPADLLFPEFDKVKLKPGLHVVHHGLCIYFTKDPANLYYRQLLEGKLRFVVLPNCLELHLVDQGIAKILGRVNVSPNGKLMIGDIPLRDKNGVIKFGKRRRFVSADLLFPELGKVKLENRFIPQNDPNTSKAQNTETFSWASFMRNKPLVRFFAERYLNQGVSLQELIDAGEDGLRRALIKYDQDRGVKFSHYAGFHIRSAMQLAIQKKNRERWGSVERARLSQFISREEGRFYQDQGEWPNDAQLAERVGLSEERVARLRQSAASRVDSLQEPINEEGDLILQDCLPDSSVVTPEEEAIRNETRVRLEEALSSLRLREQYVLKAHHGWLDDNDLPLEEIGEILGTVERGKPLPKQRIKQIEDRALGNIRESYPTLASYL
jgi:RNA polymerase primary sigma factor